MILVLAAGRTAAAVSVARLPGLPGTAPDAGDGQGDGEPEPEDAPTGQLAAPSRPRQRILPVSHLRDWPRSPAPERKALRDGAAVLQGRDGARLHRLQAGDDPPGKLRSDPFGSLVRGEELEPGQFPVR